LKGDCLEGGEQADSRQYMENVYLKTADKWNKCACANHWKH